MYRILPNIIAFIRGKVVDGRLSFSQILHNFAVDTHLLKISFNGQITRHGDSVA